MNMDPIVLDIITAKLREDHPAVYNNWIIHLSTSNMMPLITQYQEEHATPLLANLKRFVGVNLTEAEVGMLYDWLDVINITLTADELTENEVDVLTIWKP